MPHCKQVCIERCPISNLLLGYKQDLRNSSTPLLLSLGYPISISPDGPGKFGYEDSTADYFAAATAYNWTLRHLKLIAYHSINHAVCDESIKNRLIHQFDAAWNSWIQSFLQSQGIQEGSFAHQKEKESEIFAASLHWSFSGEEELAAEKLMAEEEQLLEGVRAELFHLEGFFELVMKVKKSQLYATVAAMPKGTLHSCHLHYCHDLAFVFNLLSSLKNARFHLEGCG
jgi:hypothetical protein